MVIYLNGLLPIKSNEPLITWSYKITWQTKVIISLPPQCPWPPNLERWQFTSMGSCPYSHMTLWSSGLVRSHGKLDHYIFTTTVPMVTKLGKTVTYLDKLLLIKLHDPLITWPCKIMWQPKIIISPLPQYLWPPNLTSWWLAIKGLSSIMLLHPLVPWSWETTWKTKTVIQCLYYIIQLQYLWS